MLKVRLFHSGGAVYQAVTFMVTPVKFDKKTPLDDPSVVNGIYGREQPSGGWE